MKSRILDAGCAAQVGQQENARRKETAGLGKCVNSRPDPGFDLQPLPAAHPAFLPGKLFLELLDVPADGGIVNLEVLGDLTLGEEAG